MPANRDDYIVNGKHVSPIDSQEKGNGEAIAQGYSTTTAWLERYDSSMPREQFILGGGQCPSVIPKAWIGAQDLFNLSVNNSGFFASKMGQNRAVIRGTASVANSQVEVCTEDTKSIYGYERGPINPFGVSASKQPKAENCLLINAIADDVTIENSTGKVSLTTDWERSIRFIPTTITPGARVYLISKGHTDASNCEFAISYDDTNIYRTIGGTDKIVGSTASILSTTTETRLAIVYKGTATTPWDSFYINNASTHKETTDLIGVATSGLTECVGGLRSGNTEGAASIQNALGYYRQYLMYGEDRLLHIREIDNQQKAAYNNYNTSLIVFGIGDSIMNGYHEDSEDRDAAFFFQTENYLHSLGIDCIFSNQGTSGSAYPQITQQDTPYPAYYNKDVDFNIIADSVYRWIAEYGADIIVANSGTNDLSSSNIQDLPFPGSGIVASLQMIHECCARLNVPFIHNSCGMYRDSIAGNRGPSTLHKFVRNHIVSRSTNIIDWSWALTNPVTGYPDEEVIFDSIHPSAIGYKIISKLLNQKMLGYFKDMSLIAPNATWDRPSYT